MRKKNKIGQKIALTSVATVLVFTVVIAPAPSQFSVKVRAETLAELQQKAEQLKVQATEADNQANDLAQQGNTLEATIAELNKQIRSAENQIAMADNRLAQLDIQISDTQKDLEKQKLMLKASIKELYKNSGASSVELIVGSDSFTQYFNNQTYLDKLKGKVQETTNKSIDLQKQLVQQQADQTVSRQQQKDSNARTVALKQQKDSLLADTRGQETVKRASASEYKAKRAEAEQQMQDMAALAAKLAAENVRQTTAPPANNTPAPTSTPTSDDNTTTTPPETNNQVNTSNFSGQVNGGYPARWAYAPQDSLIDDWGMYNRECVSYTAFKVWQSGRYMPYWGGVGNAKQWPGNAIRAGIPVDRNPRPGDGAIWTGGYYGHAMYVESVNGRMVTVSQYNFVYGAYSVMTISADNSAMGALQFIHF